MKRTIILGVLLLVGVAGALALVWQWRTSEPPSRFQGPRVGLGLTLNVGTDPRSPLLLRASITSPRAQTAQSAGEPLERKIVVGSGAAGWWEPLLLERLEGDRWKAVPFTVTEPDGATQIDLATGEGGLVLLTVSAADAGRGKQSFRLRMEHEDEWYASSTLEVDRTLELDTLFLELDRAEAAVQTGEPSKALEMLDALGSDADSVTGHILRARAHEALGELERALAEWKIALSYHNLTEGPPVLALIEIERLERALSKDEADPEAP